MKIWCCYKTVDFATATSQNGVCITQGKCHKMILKTLVFLSMESLKEQNPFCDAATCSHCRIHRYVAAPKIYFEDLYNSTSCTCSIGFYILWLCGCSVREKLEFLKNSYKFIKVTKAASEFLLQLSFSVIV
jgi:hypothetical protein